MRFISFLISSLMFTVPSAFADQAPIVSAKVIRLSDAPSAVFNTSGWSNTNSSNPVILTPDLLTNAMIGVSRLAKGQPLLRSQVTVPESLDVESIRKAVNERLRGKANLSINVIEILSLDGRHS